MGVLPDIPFLADLDSIAVSYLTGLIFGPAISRTMSHEGDVSSLARGYFLRPRMILVSMSMTAAREDLPFRGTFC